MRRLELQLQECRVREEELQRRAGVLQTQVNDANRRAEASNRRSRQLQTQVEDVSRRAEELQTQVEDVSRRAGEWQTQMQGAEHRVQVLQRSLAETTQELRQFEDRLQANSTHWVVKKEEIELTGPQLGVGGWATVTVAKFRGI